MPSKKKCKKPPTAAAKVAACNAAAAAAACPVSPSCESSDDCREEITNDLSSFIMEDKKLKDIVIVQSCVRRFLAKVHVEKLRNSSMQLERTSSLESLSSTCTLKRYSSEQDLEWMATMINPPNTKLENSSEQDLESMVTLVNTPNIITRGNKRASDEMFVEENKDAASCKVQKLEELESFPTGLPELDSDERRFYENLRRCEDPGVRNFFDDIYEEEYAEAYADLFESYLNFDRLADKLKKSLHVNDVEIDSYNALFENIDIKNSAEENNDQEKGEASFLDFEAVNKFCDEEEMLAFEPKLAEKLANRLVAKYDHAKVVKIKSIEVPAKTMYMCLRYCDSRNDSQTAFTLLQSFVRSIKNSIKQDMDFLLIAFWIRNTYCLLNYLKQFAQPHVRPSPLENDDSKLNDYCLRNIDLSNLWDPINESVQWMCKKALKHMKSETLHLIVPEILEDEPDIEEIRDKNLNMYLSEYVFFMRTCNLDRHLVLQIFGKYFDFLSSVILSNIMSRKELCCNRRGVHIRFQLRHLEIWANWHGLTLATVHLAPAIQATRFLQMMNFEENDLKKFSMSFDKLSSSHLYRILDSYTPTNYENPMSERVFQELLRNIGDKEDLNDTMMVDCDESYFECPFKEEPNFFQDDTRPV